VLVTEASLDTNLGDSSRNKGEEGKELEHGVLVGIEGVEGSLNVDDGEKNGQGMEVTGE